MDAAGGLYIADDGNGRIRKVSNGVISTIVGGGSVFGETPPLSTLSCSISLALPSILEATFMLPTRTSTESAV